MHGPTNCRSKQSRQAACDNHRMDENRIEELRQQLLAEREGLLELGRSSGDSSATVELDQARTGRLTRMDALQAQAMAKAGDERARQRLRQIDAALARMQAGEYGDCRDCGVAIASGRLAADPCALFCVDCAAARQA